MKPSDIAALHESGLISGEQHARIIEYLRLKKGESKFLAILAWIGAVLVIGGGVQGHTETATLFIYRALDERQYIGAYSAALILGLFSLILVMGSDWLRGRKR